jgi:hypothetical protein
VYSFAIQRGVAMGISAKGILLSLLVLGICSCRPLTLNETASLQPIYRPTARNTVDFNRITLWTLDRSREQALREATELVRTEIREGKVNLARSGVSERQLVDAIEILLQPSRRRPRSCAIRGLTVGYAIYLSENYPDYSVDTCDRSILSHEVAHVWQWQNRELTGYSLAAVIIEHIRFKGDVYKYEIIPGRPFLRYRYEQQGKMVEDYVRSGLSNQVLGNLISQAMDADELVRFVDRRRRVR